MFTVLLTQRYNSRQFESLAEYILQSPIFWLLITIIIFFILIKGTRKEFHSHWNTLLDGCKLSSKEFYDELKKELANTKVPGINSHTIYLKEGNMFSSRRMYLRINWKNYRYDVCAAPFANGFFISWWILNKTGIVEYFISRFPIGLWLVRKFDPVTYYKIDTASMFQTYCQQAVHNVIERLTKETGVRPLTDEQKKPILNQKNIFKR